MQEQFDSLARDLARGDLSRRRFLRLLGGLGGAAGLATLGIRSAGAQEEGEQRRGTLLPRPDLTALLTCIREAGSSAHLTLQPNEEGRLGDEGLPGGSRSAALPAY